MKHSCVQGQLHDVREDLSLIPLWTSAQNYCTFVAYECIQSLAHHLKWEKMSWRNIRYNSGDAAPELIQCDLLLGARCSLNCHMFYGINRQKANSLHTQSVKQVSSAEYQWQTLYSIMWRAQLNLEIAKKKKKKHCYAPVRTGIPPLLRSSFPSPLPLFGSSPQPLAPQPPSGSCSFFMPGGAPCQPLSRVKCSGEAFRYIFTAKWWEKEPTHRFPLETSLQRPPKINIKNRETMVDSLSSPKVVKFSNSPLCNTRNLPIKNWLWVPP